MLTQIICQFTQILCYSDSVISWNFYTEIERVKILTYLQTDTSMQI